MYIYTHTHSLSLSLSLSLSHTHTHLGKRVFDLVIHIRMPRAYYYICVLILLYMCPHFVYDTWASACFISSSI